jgi:hypothetical protein
LFSPLFALFNPRVSVSIGRPDSFFILQSGRLQCQRFEWRSVSQCETTWNIAIATGGCVTALPRVRPSSTHISQLHRWKQNKSSKHDRIEPVYDLLSRCTAQDRLSACGKSSSAKAEDRADEPETATVLMACL